MPSAVANVIRVLVVVLAIAVVLQLGSAVVDSIATGQDGIRTTENDTVELGSTGDWTTINTGEGFDQTVYDSRGHAVTLTGADDSYVESEQEITVAEDDTWTVATWARVDPAAENDTMTAVSANGRVLIEYNGTDGNWSAWYYDEGSRDSWRVNVSAPDQPGNLTLVTASSNGTHLWIYANTTKGDVKNISGSNVEAASVNATNWNGRLDETRTFDDATNDSEQSTLQSNPVAPRPDRNRTARIMYDEPNRGTQNIFFTSSRLTQSNVTFSDGLDGNELTEGTDYEWNQNGPKIKPLSGGAIDGAPVAYVDYQLEQALSNVIGAWASAVSLAAIIPVLLIAAFIITRVKGV